MLTSEYFEARERLRQLLKRITYKPGWEFLVPTPSDDRWRDVVQFFITRSVHDLSQPDSLEMPKKLTMYFGIEVYMLLITDEKWLLQYIFDCVTRFELHERDEWYKVDGKCFKEPHPERTGKKS